MCIEKIMQEFHGGVSHHSQAHVSLWTEACGKEPELLPSATVLPVLET